MMVDLIQFSMKRIILFLALLICLAVSARAGVTINNGPVNVLGNTNFLYQTNSFPVNVPGFTLTLGNVTNGAAVFIGNVVTTITLTNQISYTNSYSPGTGTNGVTVVFQNTNVQASVVSSFYVSTGTNTIPVSAQ